MTKLKGFPSLRSADAAAGVLTETLTGRIAENVANFGTEQPLCLKYCCPECKLLANKLLEQLAGAERLIVLLAKVGFRKTLFCMVLISCRGLKAML